MHGRARFVAQVFSIHRLNSGISRAHNMTTPTDFPAVPDKLSDVEARRLLDQVAPRLRRLTETIAGNNARAEQGQEQAVALQARAMQHFGTGEPDKIRAELDMRSATNAQRVRALFEQMRQQEEAIQNMTKPLSAATR